MNELFDKGAAMAFAVQPPQRQPGPGEIFSRETDIQAEHLLSVYFMDSILELEAVGPDERANAAFIDCSVKRVAALVEQAVASVAQLLGANDDVTLVWHDSAAAYVRVGDLEKGFSFELEFTLEAVKAGSFTAKLKLALKNFDSRAYWASTLAGLSVAAIVAITALVIADPPPIPENLVEVEGYTYICTIDDTIGAPTQADWDNIVRSLIDNPNYTEAELKKTWIARQTCLKMLGFYGGRIDGDPGRRTVQAMADYEEATGERIKWHSGQWLELFVRRANTKWHEDMRRYLKG